ncbi:MAG: DUF4186 domain-containing protein [Methylomonas sp.]
MRDLDELFRALGRSAFRSKFHLQGKDIDYLRDKGLETVLDHGRDFIGKRLASAHPKNDGKQTPFRGHPVFVAQHATACCCRGCLEKWHGIRQGATLTTDQENYIINVLERWLINEMSEA